nr:pentatricopeptide repeat protein AaPPR947 [Agave angustifolia]
MKPNAAIWGALLTACRIHRDYETGTRVGNTLITLDPNDSGRYINLANIFAARGEWNQGVGNTLITLDPNDSGRYINLANIFAARGEWNQAAMVRKMMKERKVSKLPGSSLISLDGKAHEFLAGDRSHPETQKIHVEWSQILGRLEEEGYIPETEDLQLDLEEEEKETSIYCHSEKLAITFGLIRTEPGSTIRIIKNLRVCRDCHNVSKLISKVYDRKIIMRDRSRYHIFKEGHCSCRDYW